MNTPLSNTVADFLRPACHDWPRETRVGDRKMLVFARCACGELIPIDYRECNACNPYRTIHSMGHEGRDDLKIRGIKGAGACQAPG